MKPDGSTATVVTGAASGLGRATAKALAVAGVKLAIFDLDEELGDAAANEIAAIFRNLDIRSEESVLARFQKACATQGQERILVHCGVAARAGKTLSKDRQTGRLKQFSTEDYAFCADLIATASHRVASLSALGMAALDPLDDRERGVITLKASVAAQDAQVGQVAYGSLKAAVNGLALPMVRDVIDFRIRVNSVMLGMFATPSMLSAPANVLDALNASVRLPKHLGN